MVPTAHIFLTIALKQELMKNVHKLLVITMSMYNKELGSSRSRVRHILRGENNFQYS